MKALLISIRPEHALNILNGNKTRELRKSVPKGFVGWVYGYVSKRKPYLYNFAGLDYGKSDKLIEQQLHYLLNGTIPFRFWFDEYKTLEYRKKNKVLMWDNNYYYYTEEDNTYRNVQWILDELRLEHQQVLDYGKGKDLYAWHIKKLEVFDKPMELEEFQNYMPKSNDIPEALITSSWQILHQPLTKAPQSWQYVYVKGE
ncbi:MAG: hypothetical protein RBR50_10140 [Candidatus Izemoplasmatales bacterium]|nr:hypothetical protein [Candidatus Izemoplasmatales bacterium]